MGAEVPDPAPAVKKPGHGVRFLFQAAVASGFFTGYFPFAPATVTSLFTLLPAYFLSRQPLLAAGVIVVIFFLGVFLADELEKVWGKDPARVTIDEIVGTFITFFLNPVSFAGLAVGFVLWRGFDILKLPFINRVQDVRGGWGVMLDDVLAGICANLILRALILIIPQLGI
ncbi:phosphatidylglycerophosphatase A [candidate division WOR-3 bacterium]|nr:phosphatidylglycerophosphatase A [candidate division WOR-3 bacterium]